MAANNDKQVEDESWLREWSIPEEDRRLLTSQPWRGEARWFRSPNVVCLETERRKRTRPHA
jgi:hypothetical protein